MEVNLNTAHKYLSRLKAYQNLQKKPKPKTRNRYYDEDQNETKPEGIICCESLLKFGGTAEEKEEKILYQVERYKESYYEMRQVSLDIICIQQSIHKANVETEADEMLSMISFYNADIAGYKHCLNKLDETKFPTVSELKNLIRKFENDEVEDDKLPTFIHVFTKEDLSREIKIRQKKITELEQKLMLINGKTLVTINISDKSKDILGL